MATAPLYTTTGNSTASRELPAVFSRQVNAALVQEAVRVQLANRRVSRAHTKTRGEISGGGKKPWRQKGTGRARAGSIRSPLWRGGGTVFGPRNSTNYKLRFNKQSRRAAVAMVLADKVASNQLVLVDSFDVPTGKTKELVTFLKRLPAAPSRLLVTGTSVPALFRAAANLPGTNAVLASQLNPYDLLRHQQLVVEAATLDGINTQFGSKRP